MTPFVQESAGDVLAGLERPGGDAAGLQDLGARYGAGAAALTSQAQQLVRMVGRVLGQGWSGSAAAACGAACVRSAQAVLVAARAYERAGAALVSHGARLAVAQAEFDGAGQLAGEALVEERARRAAAGDGIPVPSFDEVVWRSPLRVGARVRAEQAVADAAASARAAAAVLQEEAAALTPAPTPSSEEGHWYDQATGFATGLWDGVAEPVAMAGGLVGLNGDAGRNWAALASGLGHAVTHPGDFAKAVVGWEDLSRGEYGHWLGEFAPTVAAAFFSGGAAAGLKGADAAAAATRAGEAVTTAASMAKGLPGALKDVRVLIAQTPDGLRLPAGLDTTSLQKLLSEASGTAAAGARLPKPSLLPDPDAVPRGLPKRVPASEAPENKLALQRENETALVLRRKYGYDVEQLPEVKGRKNPDYSIEGNVFDNYAPTSSSARNIASIVLGKVESEQAQRIVLNLDDSAVTLEALRRQFAEWPIPRLEEVLALRGGELFRVYP